MKAFAAVILAAIVAGCGGGATPPNASAAGVAAQRTQSSPTYTLLHSFQGDSDGRDPHGGPLIDVKGTLYGTTEYGGGTCHDRCYGGTVFSITTSGNESIVYSFETSPKNDGKNPRSDLTNVDGILYGDAVDGGNASCYCGAVFKVTRSGVETVLHRFTGEPDGFGPDESSLLNINGTLYGTTAHGGTSNEGSVYAVTTSGTESVLHSFTGAPDGFNPKSSLINVNGTMYGTTSAGGAYCATQGGCGTVFTLTPSGTENVLYRFKGGTGDGRLPEQEALLNVHGTLYGTTQRGGTYNLGTVFSITTSGVEKVLHSFGGKQDGIYPYGGVINVHGTFYGTTSNGGAVKCGMRYGGIPGCGTVYSITPSGTETVLHSFGATGDGKYPYAAPIDVKGTLYGTATAGGSRDAGIVYSLVP